MARWGLSGIGAGTEVDGVTVDDNDPGSASIEDGEQQDAMLLLSSMLPPTAGQDSNAQQEEPTWGEVSAVLEETIQDHLSQPHRGSAQEVEQGV